LLHLRDREVGRVQGVEEAACSQHESLFRLISSTQLEASVILTVTIRQFKI
jgi:hypothetical protein